jgi:hypothetical protein
MKVGIAPKALGGLAVLGAMLATSDASAFEFGTPATKGPYHSSQDFAFEVRFGPYKPNIDEEPGLVGKPYEKSFGSSPRIYFGLEFDWQFYRIPGIGTLGPALELGRVSMSRDARTVTGRVSGDSYSLTIYPIYLDAVLRVDQLWRAYGVPLMPYGKLGMGIGLWDASNAIGTSTANGVKGSGKSVGETFAIGGAFPLDFFDSGSSRAMDSTSGINTTNVYFEYYWLDLSGFGATDTFRVGTRSWVAGMMFEF